MRPIAASLPITLAALVAAHAAPAAAQRGYEGGYGDGYDAGYGLANPAATYCVQIGGRSITRYDRDGAAAGYCRLRDGREVDEWALYRDRGSAQRDDRRAGMRDPAASYCTRIGGRYYVASDRNYAPTGWCRTRDGRTWDAWQLYRTRAGGDARRWSDDRGYADPRYGDDDGDRAPGEYDANGCPYATPQPYGYQQPYPAAPSYGDDQRYRNDDRYRDDGYDEGDDRD